MTKNFARRARRALAVWVVVICAWAGVGENSPLEWQGVRAGDVCLRVPAHWHGFTAEMKAELHEEGATVLGFWASATFEEDPQPDAVALCVLAVEEALLAEVIAELDGDEGSERVECYQAPLAGRPGIWLVYRIEDLYDLAGLEGRLWLAYQADPLPQGRHLLFTGTEPAVSSPCDSVIGPILRAVATCTETRPPPDAMDAQPQ